MELQGFPLPAQEPGRPFPTRQLPVLSKVLKSGSGSLVTTDTLIPVLQSPQPDTQDTGQCSPVAGPNHKSSTQHEAGQVLLQCPMKERKNQSMKEWDKGQSLDHKQMAVNHL